MTGFRSLFLAAVGTLLASPAILAAPVNCAQEARGDFAFVDYELERGDPVTSLLEVSYRGIGVGDAPETCQFVGRGFVDTDTRTGTITLDRGDVYEVTSRGDLGASFFDIRFTEPDGTPQTSSGSFPLPRQRLELRPRGGQDLDYLFPLGVSLTYEPCVGEICGEIGVFPIIFVEDGLAELIDQDDIYAIAPIPLPPALLTAAGALALLGWIGRRRKAG